jgi:hypothetical protein
MDDKRKLFDKAVFILDRLMDDPDTCAHIHENINGKAVIFVTNWDRYEFFDLEEDPSKNRK